MVEVITYICPGDVRWDEFGPWGMLSEHPWTVEADPEIHPKGTVLACPDHDPYWEARNDGPEQCA